jgi:hypothetical protein
VATSTLAKFVHLFTLAFTSAFLKNFWGAILRYSQSGNDSCKDFAKFWLKSKWYSKFFKITFYISGYLLEESI